MGHQAFLPPHLPGRPRARWRATAATLCSALGPPLTFSVPWCEFQKRCLLWLDCPPGSRLGQQSHLCQKERAACRPGGEQPWARCTAARGARLDFSPALPAPLHKAPPAHPEPAGTVGAKAHLQLKSPSRRECPFPPGGSSPQTPRGSAFSGRIVLRFRQQFQRGRRAPSRSTGSNGHARGSP